MRKADHAVDGGREKRTVSIKELADLYIKKNYSMELVATVTGIPIAPLSRIFQKYRLPEYKQALYNGRIVSEKTRLEQNVAVPEQTNNRNAEDLFFEDDV